jgi:hypothetical protein
MTPVSFSDIKKAALRLNHIMSNHEWNEVDNWKNIKS